MQRTPPRSDQGQGGSVTAEAALTLPVVMAVVLVVAWALSLGVAEIRAVDAARDGARQAARGDDPAAVREAAERTAPSGSRIQLHRDGDMVAVTVSVVAHAPRWLLVPLPPVHLSSTSTVEVEGDESPNT